MTTAKKIHQQVMDYTHSYDGVRRTERRSFGYLDKAIDDAKAFIEKRDWRDHEVHHVEIVNKETGEVEWSWHEDSEETWQEVNERREAIARRMDELERQGLEYSDEYEQLIVEARKAYEDWQAARSRELAAK